MPNKFFVFGVPRIQRKLALAIECPSGVDYGAQDREMFRPSLFGDVMVPEWKLVCDAVHEFSHVKVDTQLRLHP